MRRGSFRALLHVLCHRESRHCTADGETCKCANLAERFIFPSPLAGFLLSCHISRLSLATASARETEPHQKIVSFSDFRGRLLSRNCTCQC